MAQIGSEPENSYRPSANADVQTDFRSRAVAASEMMRRSLPAGLSPERAGISCCLARQPSLARIRKPIKITAVASAVLGLSGLVIGPIIFHLQRGISPAEKPGLAAIAFCCSVGGMLLLFLPLVFERWIVRQQLSRREDATGFGGKGTHVALEHASTYGSLKMLAEDAGLIYIHPEARYVMISGLSYVYVIQSKDVVGLSLHPNGKTVLLSYAVENEQLDLAILPRSVLAELKRQTLGSSRSLFVKIQDALKVQR
jgi:hypothetical protein